MNQTAEQTFYWFDYETFGTSAAWDKPAQFAGQRTTLDLEPIGEPLIVYCKPPLDYLPHPEACLVTGMDPADIAKRGIPEPEFIATVVAQIGKPGTCSVGYNSIRFDDEFTRHTLFRNFHDAYEYEWKNGNSRWDLLDVVRMTRALRPEGMNWPVMPDGTPTNKLELLTQANAIAHGNAHDALSDVEATLDVARLLKQKQPKLFHYAFSNKDKKSIGELLNLRTRTPCVHVSGMIPARFGHTGVIVPVARDSKNQNSIIVLDLRSDPKELAQLDVEAIKQRVFSSNDALGDTPRLHLKTVQINRCPMISPIGTLNAATAERLNIDLDVQLARAKTLQAMLSGPDADALIQKILTAMARHYDPSVNAPDVDGTLYSGGFVDQADKKRMEIVRKTAPEQLSDLIGLFDEKRLNEMFWRFRARNYQETLTEDEKAEWRQHCQDRLLPELNDSRSSESGNSDKTNSSGTNPKKWLNFEEFEEAMAAIEWTDETSHLEQSLMEYADQLRETILRPW